MVIRNMWFPMAGSERPPQRSAEEVKEDHSRYLMAVGNPIRREILRVLLNEEATLQILQQRTGLDCEILEWHLGILEHGRCVKKETKNGTVLYRITQEGRVIDYLKP